MNVCEHCGGRTDRPGLWRCESDAHPVPDLAQRIAAEIEFDIRDRRGLKREFDQIDDDIQYEIRDAWAEIIRKMMVEGDEG